MKAPSIVVLAAVLLLAACAAPTSEITHKTWETTSRLSAGETIAVTGEHELAQCITDALTKASPKTQIIGHEKFRGQLFPWFEPATAPRSAEALRSLLERPRVSKRLHDLAVRYVVFVEGSTHVKPFHGGVPYAGIWAGAKKDTSLEVSVWDVKSGDLAGRLNASASGTAVYGFVLYLPIIAPAPTESMACGDIASKLAEFLGNESSQAK
jgi:hypothetical protein